MSFQDVTLHGDGQDAVPLARQMLLHIARNVSRARGEAGLTQAQLAEASDLSRATIHLVEGGIGDPRLSTLAQLAEALDVDLFDLLCRPE
jgi:transcriptional regulator with XRE-family HTH domain